MITRRDVCAGLGVAALAGPARAALLRPSIDDEPSLRNFAKARGIVYGAATSNYALDDATFAPVFKRDAGMIVPEYEMKRGTMERQRGTIDFAPCDRLLAFARANGMIMRGHTLLWHKANPDWLEKAVLDSRDETIFTGYIAKVMGHYRGALSSWDVVNEVIAPRDGRADNLRETFWLKAFGPSYIDRAYHAARAADPDAMLVYNDWGCELGAPENDTFRAATLNFLDGLLKRGVPIDALGLQGHLSAFGAQVDQKKLRIFLDAVKVRGLKILITEHDVDDSGGTPNITTRDRAVADASARFLDTVLDNDAVIAVLTWGLSDKFIDPPGWRARLAGYSPRMLPRDTAMRKKPMWKAMARAFAA